LIRGAKAPARIAPLPAGRPVFNTEVSHVHHPATPKVGFVTLGCPKALVDSERILTQLRMEGYEVVPTYEDADVVVVNTCGFIDSAKAESLEVIGEAIKENGKVIVTGCMGVEEGSIRDVHPSVLSVTGPQQYEQVVNAVHEVVPPRQDHNPLIDLVPPQGVKLTPRHYAYLKISEGCNHSSFCIIPSMRGKLVSRPVGEVLTRPSAWSRPASRKSW
jgi:ribosomal protein S12 methylthiotransferase